jgi:hypothetical protein
LYRNRALRRELRGSYHPCTMKLAELIMGCEGSSYSIKQGVLSLFFALVGDPHNYDQARAAGQSMPSNHPWLFAPDVQPELRTGIMSRPEVLRNLLNGPGEDLPKSLAKTIATAGAQ